MIEKDQRYKHYKGNEYEIITLAKDSDILEELVVYMGLYKSEFRKNPIWVRSLKEFTSLVQLNGKEIEPFKRIS